METWFIKLVLIAEWSSLNCNSLCPDCRSTARDKNCTWMSTWIREIGRTCVKTLRRATVLSNEQVLFEYPLESHDRDTYLYLLSMMLTWTFRQRIHFCSTRLAFPLIRVLWTRAISKLVTETSIRSSIKNHRLSQQESTAMCWNLFHGNNEYSDGTQLNRTNFGSMIFPFVYFDLTKQKLDVRDGTTKLTFKCELSGTTATHYTVYALTLYEQDVELLKTDGKIILRT